VTHCAAHRFRAAIYMSYGAEQTPDAAGAVPAAQRRPLSPKAWPPPGHHVTLDEPKAEIEAAYQRMRSR